MQKIRAFLSMIDARLNALQEKVVRVAERAIQPGLYVIATIALLPLVIEAEDEGIITVARLALLLIVLFWAVGRPSPVRRLRNALSWAVVKPVKVQKA